MEMQPVLQSLKVPRHPPEKAKTSSRAEDRARGWSQLRLQTEGGNEEGAPFARRAGGLILSSAEAAKRTRCRGRFRKHGGVDGDRIRWGQRSVSQAARRRRVQTLIIGTPYPHPLAMLPPLCSGYSFAGWSPSSRPEGRGWLQGISSASSWGSPWRLGGVGTCQSAALQVEGASTAKRGILCSRQEIKWQATLQASVWGWWEASPSLLDLFWQECCGE